MPLTLTDCHDLYAALSRMCSDCRAKLGLVTHGPNLRPLPSSCPFCDAASETFGPRPVPYRNGTPHGPDGE